MSPHAHASARAGTRVRAATVEAPSTSPHLPDPVLKFDFQGRRAAAAPRASGSQARDGSIKEAIIRWLNEQL